MCDPQPSPLAYRVPMNAGVRTNNFARGCHDLAGGRPFTFPVFVVEIPVNKFGVFPIRHKADLLRFSLFCCVKLRFAGDLSDLFLYQFTEGKIRTSKLILCQLPKKIALVLPMVSTAEKPIPIDRLIIFDASVMPGRYLVTAETLRHSIERSK